MPITIGSNISSLSAQRALERSTKASSDVHERLSSGQRITRASDDAAGLAIADNLRSDAKVFSQGIRNFNDGISYLNIADGALGELSNIVVRVRELAERAANGTFSSKQRQAIDTEAQALNKEYTRILKTTKFNGLSLFDGSVSSVRFQGGYGTEGGISASVSGTMGTGSFNASTSYTADSTVSYAVDLGDLNNDGVLDLVTAGYSGTGGTATVRLGIGDGTFATGVSYSTESTESRTIQLGDLNNDGILDLVTAGQSAGAGVATVRLGRGNGSFAAARSYTTETVESFGVTLGDLNGDGVLDLITAGSVGASGAATVRLGAGDGSFGAATSYTTETTGSRAVTVGDVNNDGILDLVTGGTSAVSGVSTVRLGTGDGTFKAATSYVAESNATRAVVLADLNGDGVNDLLTAGQRFGGGGYATVRIGTGSGTFSAATSYAMEGATSEGLTVGDFNGDGILDLATSGYDVGGFATIRLGAGDGTFSSATSYTAEGNRSQGVATGDINSDGVLDLVTAGFTGGVGYANTRLGATRGGGAPLLPFSLQNISDAKSALSTMSSKLDQLSTQRGNIGALQSRLGSAITSLYATKENSLAAESRIRDTDIAADAANSTRLLILQKSAAAVLAQANQLPALALQLLGF